MEISAIALAGMHAVQTRIEPTATRIAHVLEPEAHIGQSTDFATLMEWRHNVAANLKILKTGDQRRQSVLDLLSDLRWG